MPKTFVSHFVERNYTHLTNENKFKKYVDVGNKNITSVTNKTTLLKKRLGVFKNL